MATTAPKKKAAQAAKEEATDITIVEFEYDGETYTVSSETVDDLDVLEEFEQGKMITFIKLCLGNDQWATFKSKKRTSKDLDGLATAMFEAKAVDPGESEG